MKTLAIVLMLPFVVCMLIFLLSLIKYYTVYLFHNNLEFEDFFIVCFILAMFGLTIIFCSCSSTGQIPPSSTNAIVIPNEIPDLKDYHKVNEGNCVFNNLPCYEKNQ